MLSSAGEICGHHVQPPTSVVAHTFTGTATIEESGRPRRKGREAFLEISMAADGSAGVFATTGDQLPLKHALFEASHVRVVARLDPTQVIRAPEPRSTTPRPEPG